MPCGVSSKLPLRSCMNHECRGLEHPIYYYQDGAGPCNASADAAAAPAPAPAIEPHVRSFGAWMRSLPDSNPVIIAAMIVSVPSGAGCDVLGLSNSCDAYWGP